MIKIKLTWPALILILIALAVWLARDPGQRTAPSRRSSPRSAPQSPRHQPTPDRDGSDYDTETRRLDEAAAAAGQQIFDQSPIIEMPKASWRNKS